MIGYNKKSHSPWRKNKYLKGLKIAQKPKRFYRKNPRNISSNRILFFFSLVVLGSFWLYENPEYITSKLSGLTSSDTRPQQNKNILEGKITHVRDGDTFEVVGKAVRIAALDCPENSTPEGKRVTKFAQRFQGQYAVCGLTGATTYDRVVGYCKINGVDFGKTMMDNTSCKLWKKYDVWNKY
jgi:hypothetical protein